MIDRFDGFLAELSDVHRELHETPDDDFATKHALHVRADEIRRRLVEVEPDLTAMDRGELTKQLAALKALKGEYVEMMREERWGTQLSIWLLWRRLFRHLSLENRPGYAVPRRPDHAEPRRFARYSPNNLPVLVHFQPEIMELNNRIAYIEELLSPNRRRLKHVRHARRHGHPDDERNRRAG